MGGRGATIIPCLLIDLIPDHFTSSRRSVFFSSPIPKNPPFFLSGGSLRKTESHVFVSLHQPASQPPHTQGLPPSLKTVITPLYPERLSPYYSNGKRWSGRAKDITTTTVREARVFVYLSVLQPGQTNTSSDFILLGSRSDGVFLIKAHLDTCVHLKKKRSLVQ